MDRIIEAVNDELGCFIPKNKVVMALLDTAVRLSRSPEWSCQVKNLCCVDLKNWPAHVACQCCGLEQFTILKCVYLKALPSEGIWVPKFEHSCPARM